MKGHFKSNIFEVVTQKEEGREKFWRNSHTGGLINFYP